MKGSRLIAFSLVIVWVAIAPAQTYTLVTRSGPVPTLTQRVNKRVVIGFDTPVGIAEYHPKSSSCSGSYNPFCPWTAPWATLHSNYVNTYVGYSGGGVVPTGKKYTWYYTYRLWFGHEKWSILEDGLTLYYERVCSFDDDLSDILLEDEYVYVPPGGEQGGGGG